MTRKDAFKRAAERYLEEIQHTRAEATHESYRYVLMRFHRIIKELGITTYIARWRMPELEKIISARSHLLPNPFIQEITVLRRMLLHSGIDYLDKALRTGRIRLPRPSRVNVRWYSDEILAMARANAIDDATTLMLVFAGDMGLRRGEICKVQVTDLHADTLIVRGKGGKLEPIPLTHEQRRAINSYLLVRQSLINRERTKNPNLVVPPEILIWGRGGELHTYAPGTVTHKINLIGNQLGISLSPHDCRRTCGRETYLATEGDIYAVNRLLRHENLDMTKRYIGADVEVARKAVEAREKKRASIDPLPLEPVIQSM